jgi:hypothetical protein
MTFCFVHTLIFRNVHKVIAWNIRPLEHIHFITRNFNFLCFKAAVY